MKNKLAILLALLMSLNTAAAVYAEDGTGGTVPSEEGIVTEEIPDDATGGGADDPATDDETTVTVANEAALREVIENPLTANTTVILDTDITGVSGRFQIPNSGEYRLTLDMNGHTISAAETFDDDMIVNLGDLVVTGNGTFEVTGNAFATIANERKLEIVNGTFINTSQRSGVGAVYSNADLTIHGGEFTGAFFAVVCDGGRVTIGGGLITGTNNGQPALEVRRGAKVTIKGGTISSPHGAIGVADGESTVVINDGTCRSTNDRYVFVGNLEAFTLNGGSYEGNGADYGYLRDRLGQFVGEGKTVTIMGESYTAPVIPKDGISEGTVEVTTAEGLAAALAQPLTGEKTVVLKANIEGISGKIKVPNSGDNLLVLDMGDYSISAADDYGNIVIENYGKMVIEGGSYSFNAAKASRIILNKGSLDIYGGEYNASVNDGTTAVYNAGGHLWIDGGKFTGFYAVWCDGGRLIVENGTFIGNNQGQPALDVRGGANVTINNGRFTSYHAAIGIADSGSRVTIYNGKFEGTGKGMIMCGNLGRFTIYGGTYNVPNNSFDGVLGQIEYQIAEGSTVTINGQSYTVEPIPEGELLTGTAFGTKYWGEEDPDDGITFPSYDKAFDNDPLTYYDAYGSTLDAHVGMKFDSPTRLTKVEIIPRNNGFDAGRIFLDASDGFNNEGGDRLFDGSKDSKWCSTFHKEDENNVNFVSWQTDRPVSVAGYEIYTANDTAHFGDRNPISWSLWGSPDGQEWYVIDRQTNNYDIPEENYSCYTVNCPVEVLDENGNPVLNEDGIAETQPHQGYSYFELYIDDVPGDTFQLSEFRLLEAGNEWVRMEGMTVQGSNDGVYWKDLCTFADLDVFYAQPYTWKASRGKFVNDYSFTQFRVVNKEQHLNVAEVKFYGVPNSDLPAYDAKLPEGEHNLLDRGYIFGSEPWDNNSNAGKAFDRNTDTWFDAAGGSGINAEIGIELETPAQLTGFKVHPRESDVNRLMNLTVQGSVNGNDWITLYQFDDVQDYDYRWYEISDDMLASAAQEYAFTQFRVINKSEHLNVAEVEFIGTYEHDLESFPTEIHEPIYSYITADQFMDTAWVYYECDPENPEDDHCLDWWYFDERDEEGMTRFEREFEGLEPIILIGGVGFNDTVMDIQDIDGKPIVAVAPWAFAHEDGISKVIVNEDSDCRYILNNAFAECDKLETVTVSNSLREVSHEAFRFDERIHAFYKADGDLTDEEKEQRDWAFVTIGDYNELICRDRLICYPPAKDHEQSYRVPDSVWCIEPWALWAAQLDEITMGNNIVNIQYGAFSDSTVKTILVSPALQFLGNEAFAGCTNLTYLEIPSDKVEIDHWENENGQIEYPDWMFGGTVDYGREEPRENLVVRTYEGNMVHDYINYIKSLNVEGYDMSHVVFEAETDTYWYGGNWFEECGENEVFLLGYSAPLDAEITTMPTETYDGKTIIGICTDGEAWQAFSYDDRVGGSEGTFTIPEGIRYINNAFRECVNVRVIEIPASLEDVWAPFIILPNLEKFVVAEGSEYFETRDNGATLYCSNHDEFVLYGFAYGSGMTHVNVAEGTNCIAESVFENSSIETITLPESLCAIDWWAFAGSQLESITIPANVDRLLEYAFAYCPNLTEVHIERMTGEFCDPHNWEDQDFTTVFEGSDNVTVYVYEGTDAHRAAEEYGWNYETVQVESTVILGDVSGDGFVDSLDALAISRYIIGYTDAGVNIMLGDVNGDGKITTSDMRSIARYLAGYEDGLGSMDNGFDIPHPQPDTDDLTITVDSVIGIPGSTVSVDVKLTGNTGVASGNFWLEYDPDILTPISYSNGDILLGLGDTWSPNMEKAPLQLVFLSSAFTNEVEDGTLATITFVVNEYAAYGTYPIAVVEDFYRFYGDDLQEVACNRVDGSVTVEPADVPTDVPTNPSNPDPVVENTLTFDLNGGEGNFPAQTTTAADVDLPTDIPVREGYIFLGWDEDMNSDTPMYNPGDYLILSSDMTLYAIWMPEGVDEPTDVPTQAPDEPDVPTQTFTLVYDLNGGEGDFPAQTTTGDALIPMNMPVRDGYMFFGWDEDMNSDTPTYWLGDHLILTGDMTLYAIWMPEDVPTAPDVPDIPVDVEPTVTFVPVEQDDPTLAVFDVKLENNTGFTSLLWEIVHSEEFTLTKVDFSEYLEIPGYGYVGVPYVKDFTCVSNVDTKKVVMAATGPCTAESTVLFRLTFTVNEGTDVSQGYITIKNHELKMLQEDGTYVNVPLNIIPFGTPTTEEPDIPTQTPDIPTQAPDEPTQAPDVPTQTFTLVYDLNGGEGDFPAQTTTGDALIPTDIPVRDGYMFFGWDEDMNSDTPTYNPGDYLILSSDMTLYAIWVVEDMPTPGDSDEPAVPEDAAQIVVDNVSGSAGAQVKVVVKLENNPGIASLGCDIGYDSTKFEFVDISYGSVFTNNEANTALNPFTISTYGAKNATSDGVLATITFRILEDCEAGEYTITATNPEAVNDTYQSVACAAQNGTITVRDYIAGDVSGDGILNRADLVMFARYFARYEDASGINMAAADVTGDGTVNRGDLVKLARYFAKLETSLG